MKFLRFAAQVLWQSAPRAAAMCKNSTHAGQGFLATLRFLQHHLAVKYVCHIALMTHLNWAILLRYMLQMMLTGYFFFLLRETQTVTVEKYYTAMGTSEKNTAKFMPFALRNPARTPRVLQSSVKRCGQFLNRCPCLAGPDSRWCLFIHFTGKLTYHEVEHKRLRRGRRSQAAEISRSVSLSLLSSNVCVLTVI